MSSDKWRIVNGAENSIHVEPLTYSSSSFLIQPTRQRHVCVGLLPQTGRCGLSRTMLCRTILAALVLDLDLWIELRKMVIERLRPEAVQATVECHNG